MSEKIAQHWNDGPFRMNLRRCRADALASEVMNKIDQFIDYRDQKREIHYAILELFLTEGVEILTDYTRQEAGLPPRSGDGWTPDELRALEMRRLEVMTRPLTMPVFPLPPSDDLLRKGG